MLIITWGLAILSVCYSGVLLYQVIQSDFQPWQSAKKKLIFAGILVCAPGIVLAFQFLTPFWALVLSGVILVLAIVNFVRIFPNQRRFIGKKEVSDQ